MLSNCFKYQNISNRFVQKILHASFLTFLFMFLALVSSDSNHMRLRPLLNLINLQTSLNTIQNRHLYIHENKFKKMSFTIFIITMTHIPIFKLFNCLLAIIGCSYIKQRILHQIIIITALDWFICMNSFRFFLRVIQI
jgi:hypothetical protein